MTDNTEQDFGTLLDYLKRNRGFDFSGYKRSSLMRRIQKRMQTVNIEHYSDYVDYLEVHPDEFAYLFDTILINVTSFFRDVPAWDYIAHHIVPQIIASKKPNDPIRVWSAGCASGEEAYTIAMILAEALGPDKFRERVKIYASDVDEESLNHARQATYTSREVIGIPPALLEKYFEQIDHRYIFRKDLRRSVIFGRHNLIQDAPISRIDLLLCRNTLMYFNAEAQARILSRFHFALSDNGFLFLGKAEMLFTHANLFTPTDIKRRVFTKVSRISLRDRIGVLPSVDLEETSELSRQMRFRESAFDTNPVAQLIVDLSGHIALINERARMLFNLLPRDVGRPLQDLDISYRISELRSRVEDVYIKRQPVNLKDVEWAASSGELYYLDVQLAPLQDGAGSLSGVSLSFIDTTRYKRLQEELEHSSQELETAYEELQSTNEELETTNEELQSTIEELETTNEELQSTNEELETINEELQSTNEELQTVNEELRRRSDELNQANAFLESILTSMRGGVVVVDQDLRVQIWNHKAEDLWGLRDDEVQNKNFLNLDIGLPVEQLRQPIRACLTQETDCVETELEAVNRRGQAIKCKVTCTPQFNANGDVRGVIMVMEDMKSANNQGQ